ncbi:MAG: cation diffusion facilitator family transporter [Acidimicrobiales bacterium]|nr:cation diffusion facilitator family transporter [Acidimicrobiales bacterium]
MSHDHGHHHPAPSQRRALAISIGANTTLLVAQVVVALAIGSLALLADSIHNASDVVALVIALIGQSLALRPASARRTYGLARAEILAALVNGAVLLALTGWVVVEAIGRFDDPAELEAAPLAAIGLLGLAVNGASAWYLARSGGGSLNMRAAFWHLTSDALGSFGVIVAAGAVAFFQAAWVDPAVSIVISLLILVGVWRLLKDTIDVLLETVPGGIDPDEVEADLTSQPGVEAVHHLHIWAVDSQSAALTAHVEFTDGTDLHDAQETAEALKQLLRERHGIDHATLEAECHPCAAPDHDPTEAHSRA